MMYGNTTNYSPSFGQYQTSQSYGAQAYSSSTKGYEAREYQQPYMMPERSQNFEATAFLNPDRPASPIIFCEDDLKEMIEQTFYHATGTEYPRNGIRITVLPYEKFRKAHKGTWNEGIMGFSLNRYGKGTSEIFVREDHQDQMMLTIGHEIGHVMSPTLLNAQDEEAKAHAFSLTWMETIREHDIGGLKSHIMPNPAHNGLHDVAFDFVKRLMNAGMSTKDIFKTLTTGLISIIAKLPRGDF